MFPLTPAELGTDFDLERVLRLGPVTFEERGPLLEGWGLMLLRAQPMVRSARRYTGDELHGRADAFDTWLICDIEP